MKLTKILSLILALITVCALFASCDENFASAVHPEHEFERAFGNQQIGGLGVGIISGKDIHLADGNSAVGTLDGKSKGNCGGFGKLAQVECAGDEPWIKFADKLRGDSDL